MRKFAHGRFNYDRHQYYSEPDKDGNCFISITDDLRALAHGHFTVPWVILVQGIEDRHYIYLRNSAVERAPRYVLIGLMFIADGHLALGHSLRGHHTLEESMAADLCHFEYHWDVILPALEWMLAHRSPFFNYSDIEKRVAALKATQENKIDLSKSS